MAKPTLETLEDVAEFLQEMRDSLSELITERYESEELEDGSTFATHVGYQWASDGNLAGMGFINHGDELRERIPEFQRAFHHANGPLDVAILRDAAQLLIESDPDSINAVELIVDEVLRLIELAQPAGAQKTPRRKKPKKKAKADSKPAARKDLNLWVKLLEALKEHHGGNGEYNPRHLSQENLGKKLGIDRRQVREILEARRKSWDWYKDECGSENFLAVLCGLIDPQGLADKLLATAKRNGR